MAEYVYAVMGMGVYAHGPMAIYRNHEEAVRYATKLKLGEDGYHDIGVIEIPLDTPISGPIHQDGYGDKDYPGWEEI
jgi:hypothetical protein